MDELDLFSMQTAPTARRPLLGLTVLVVEDSRYACEAVRLLCLRSGARIRRADCLASARRHLQVYRPSVVIVDLGLPDGSGLDLISELDQATPRVSSVLATSGDDTRAGAAIEAGADGFLEKPIRDLATFQEAVLANLPPDRVPAGPREMPVETITPDPVAFQDDVAHAAELLTLKDDEKTRDYVAQFLGGVALSADDGDLTRAVESLVRARQSGEPDRAAVAQLAGLLQDRLATARAI